MRGEGPALEGLALGELQQLEEQLDEATRRVRALVGEKRAEELTCPICLDRPKNMVLAPCGHRACAECAAPLRKCHICRGAIRERVPYFS